MSEPDLEPARRLLSVEWRTVNLTSDAEALALWQQIAPTGADWQERLDEVPAEHDRALSIALLRSSNFACVPVTASRDCSAKIFDVPDPAPTAGFGDPCLRRLLALWALEQIEPEDVPSVMDGLRALVALPPPESQLVREALDAVPDADVTHKLELLTIAFKAGQREHVNAAINTLDEDHLIEAARVHHIDGALEMLSAESHRAVYLDVITDELMDGAARAKAITELAETEPEKLAVDTRKALVKATSSKDCLVAATAVRVLAQRGDKKHLPKRARTTEGMMRALCVIASYESLQEAQEPSLLANLVPASGLERVEVEYDVLADVDTDGDGDPHTQRAMTTVKGSEIVVPELEDMIRAMKRCKGTTCMSDDREFRFTFKPAGGDLVLTRLAVIERPPCARP